MSDLERRVIELEELVARIPVRWPTVKPQQTFGWATLREDLLPNAEAEANTASGDGSSRTIKIHDPGIIPANKKLAIGALVFYAEDKLGTLQLVQSTCAVAQ